MQGEQIRASKAVRVSKGKMSGKFETDTMNTKQISRYVPRPKIWAKIQSTKVNKVWLEGV